jgi:predicted RNA-binding Zn-ribbon protein involved in translation (DUF1610 family)
MLKDPPPCPNCGTNALVRVITAPRTIYDVSHSCDKCGEFFRDPSCTTQIEFTKEERVILALVAKGKWTTDITKKTGFDKRKITDIMARIKCKIEGADVRSFARAWSDDQEIMVTHPPKVTERQRSFSTETHCANGHPWTEQNMRVVDHGEREFRVCRICANEAQRQAYLRNGGKEYQREWKRKQRLAA